MFAIIPLGTERKYEPLEVYECNDHTWRVFFEHGYRTREMDDTIRKLPNKNAAVMVAIGWFAEWASQQMKD